MKIFNHTLEVNLSSRHKLTHFKIHNHNYYKHLVWGPLSVIFGQPHLIPIEVHTGCGAEVNGIGEDSISYCTECETIVEGETKFVTTEEFESNY